MRKRLIDGCHVDGIERLDLESYDLHVLAGQVAVGPYCSADQVRTCPSAACASAALSRGYLDGEWLNLAFLRPEGLQRVPDRRVKLGFVDVSEGGLTHQLCLCDRFRCRAFFWEYQADGAATAPRSHDRAFFEQRIAGVPVAMLAPLEGTP